MEEKNSKIIVLIISGVLLVLLGLGITFLVIKKPFSKTRNDTSENKRVIQLDVPGQTSEEVKKAEAGEEEVVPDTPKDTKEKDKEKTSEKKNVTTTTKKETTSEKTSETTKQQQQVQQPVVIVEDPKTAPAPTAPSTVTPTMPLKSDDGIELPFVPYEEINEN